MNSRLPPSPRPLRGRVYVLAVLAASLVAASKLAAAPAVMSQPQEPNPCGVFVRSDGGPYDYRKREPKLQIVEYHHFTPNVESLIRGNSTANIGGELAFTLRAFPNHHRALIAMVKLGEKLHTPLPPGADYPVECWLERATRFTPDDPIARMIRASWLGKHNRMSEAIDQLKVAERLGEDNPLTVYNVGLIYLELKQFGPALVQAHKAYGMGVQQPALRDGLRAAGQWRDPEAATAAAGAASAPAPAASAGS